MIGSRGVGLVERSAELAVFYLLCINPGLITLFQAQIEVFNIQTRVLFHVWVRCGHRDMNRLSRFRFPCPPTPAATGPGHSAVRRGPRATPQELRSAKLDHRATTYPLLLSNRTARRHGGFMKPLDQLWKRLVALYKKLVYGVARVGRWDA